MREAAQQRADGIFRQVVTEQPAGRASAFPTRPIIAAPVAGDVAWTAGDHPVNSTYQYAVKRVIDVVAAHVLLIVLGPLMAVLAALIKVTSPGPVLYRSARMGLDGRTFHCLKFRTMVAGAESLQAELEEQNEAPSPIFKIQDDPRATRFGAWLRASGLDELPQLINVMFGEMSLVGPRPLPLRDCALLTEDDRRRRHSLLPGMTGLWQVSPERHKESLIIKLDLEYVRTWSLWLDAKIFYRTFGIVARGIVAASRAG